MEYYETEQSIRNKFLVQERMNRTTAIEGKDATQAWPAKKQSGSGLLTNTTSLTVHFRPLTSPQTALLLTLLGDPSPTLHLY